MKLVFATNNKHKISEISDAIGSLIEIKTLADIGFSGDIPETCATLVGNALQKAEFIATRFNCNCFADDTGLEVTALGGAPGVYSARYAGESCDFEDNMNKLLNEMTGITDRRASFTTIIALVLDGSTFTFKGKIEGQIVTEKRGTTGFGYDPLFLPNGYELTFAQMPASQKNSISHRGMAVNKFTDWLKMNTDR